MSRALAAALGLMLLAGCGDPFAPPPAVSDVPWHADPRPVPPAWGLAERGRVTFHLPQADHARAASGGTAPYLVINVLENGDLSFKGGMWRLATGTPSERDAALAVVTKKMAFLTDHAELRRADGSTRVHLGLHAERNAPWQSVRTVWLSAVQDPRIRMRDFRWWVWCPSFVLEPYIRHEVRIREPWAGGEPNTIVLRATDGPVRPVVELTIGEQSWSFGDLVETLYADPTFLARANRIWREAETALEERTTAGAPVALHIAVAQQALPWAFVVKVFDLLLGAGVRDVLLVEEDLTLELRPPEAPALRPREDAPVVTPLVLLLCALAVGLAFWVAFRPLAGRRRRRA